MDWKNGHGLHQNLNKLSEEQKLNIQHSNAKIFVGMEKREGWTGELPFYIFWCPVCENFSYDYPHGHIENQYLNCHRCDVKIDFRPWWVKVKAFFGFGPKPGPQIFKREP